MARLGTVWALPDSGGEFVIGTPVAERLVGTSGSDVMFGGGGYDVVVAKGGDDILFGGPDGSTLFGGAGSDLFVFSGGQNWFMDFSASEGDILSGVDLEYLVENGTTQQVGEHLALFFGDDPWDPNGDGTIWFAYTTRAEFDDFLFTS